MGGDPNTPDPNLAFYYVSPTGDGIGTPADPADFGKALLTGKSIYMQDGVYTRDTVTVLASVTLQAAEGARPVIVHSDGRPPAVSLWAGCTVSGIWFGGAKQAADRPFQMADNCTVTGNTFFGYYGGIVEGGHVNNLYQNNRFVNCGTGGLFHDIYISGDSSSRIYDNIHIGGQGYKIHLWHSAAHADVQGNFCADGYYEMVLQSTTSQAIDNIFWNHTPPASSWLTVFLQKGTFTHNLFGHETFGTGKWDTQMNGGDDDLGLTVDSLGLIGDAYEDTTTWPGNTVTVGPFVGEGHVLPAPGTNYTHYALTDLPTLLGYSEAQIDAAIAALEESFAASVATIQADATIEGNFAILRACVDAWKVA